MAVLGYAQGATLEPLGSELTADVAAGSLVLPVEWTGQFDDGPGVLDLNGATYTYSAGAIDEDAATITLDSVTAAAATTGDAVHSVSGGEVRTELVLHVSCGGGDDIEVVVAFRDRDLWPEGEYDDPVEVLLSDDLETILDVPGRTPVRDLSENPVIDELNADLTELNEVTLPQLQDDLAANETALAGIAGMFPIGTTSISDGAISTPKIAANAVNADKIAANSINAGHIVANAIGADEIAANSIGADKIVANSIGADEIAANAIDGLTITGATMQTAASGERVAIRNDGAGGIVEFHSGVSGSSPGYVDPFTSGGRSGIRLKSGTTPAYPGDAELQIYSDSGGLGGGRFNIYSTIGSITATTELAIFTALLNVSGTVEGATLKSSAPASTAAAANTYMNSIGELAKSTSSRRYKANIKKADLDPATVLSLEPRSYTARGDKTKRRWVGFVAEEAHDAGLGAFVDYDDEGQPDGFHYGTFVAAHQVVLRDQEKRIAHLEAELAELRALITKSKGV